MTNQAKEANPIPQGKYVPATRCGNIIFTAGMTPRVNGVAMMVGCIKSDEDPSVYADVVRQAAKNALVAAQNKLENNEHLVGILSMTVYVNAEPGYTLHSRIADIASEFMCEQLGQAGVAARAAEGDESLPGNAPVEIQIVACCE